MKAYPNYKRIHNPIKEFFSIVGSAALIAVIFFIGYCLLWMICGA